MLACVCGLDHTHICKPFEANFTPKPSFAGHAGPWQTVSSQVLRLYLRIRINILNFHSTSTKRPHNVVELKTGQQRQHSRLGPIV